MPSVLETMSGSLPAEFADLVRLYPPQAIHDDVGHGNAMEVIRALLRVSGRSAGQTHYLETLSILVAAYERDHDGIDLSDLTGLDSLRHLVEENGMTDADLARILGTDAATAAAVLAGRTPVTADHAAMLGRRFCVDAGLFL